MHQNQKKVSKWIAFFCILWSGLILWSENVTPDYTSYNSIKKEE